MRRDVQEQDLGRPCSILRPVFLQVQANRLLQHNLAEHLSLGSVRCAPPNSMQYELRQLVRSR